MQTFEIVPGLKVTRDVVERLVEGCINIKNHGGAAKLIAMLDAMDADPDIEVDWEDEYDFRTAPPPPVDPRTGADIIQDLGWKESMGNQAIPKYRKGSHAFVPEHHPPGSFSLTPNEV